MKNSKEYSKKVKELYSSLKKKFPKPKKVEYENPVDAAVYATIRQNLPAGQTQAAIKRIEKDFVDLNDLRVALTEEILEALGANNASTRQIAADLSTVLNAIFITYHEISLEKLKKVGKRPARQALEKLDGMTDYVIDYCMLTAFDSHAIPLTENMIKFLKENDYVHPDSKDQDIKGFLTRQITAKNGYEFYSLLADESEQSVAKPKPKTVKKTKAKKTSEKKTKKAKKTAKKVKKTTTRKVTKKTTKKKSAPKKTKKKKTKK